MLLQGGAQGERLNPNPSAVVLVICVTCRSQCCEKTPTEKLYSVFWPLSSL